MGRQSLYPQEFRKPWSRRIRRPPVSAPTRRAAVDLGINGDTADLGPPGHRQHCAFAGPRHAGGVGVP